MICWWMIKKFKNVEKLVTEKKKKKECGKAARKLVFWPIFGPSRWEEMRKFSEGKNLISQKWMIPLKPR